MAAATGLESRLTALEAALKSRPAVLAAGLREEEAEKQRRAELRAEHAGRRDFVENATATAK